MLKDFITKQASKQKQIVACLVALRTPPSSVVFHIFFLGAFLALLPPLLLVRPEKTDVHL